VRSVACRCRGIRANRQCGGGLTDLTIIESTTRKRFARDLLECELWLFAMCLQSGLPLAWEIVDRWLDALLRESAIGARA
jgi:hypothetical protein